MKFANPRNDVAFKKIFGDEHKKHILISFLNAVLNLQDEREIADLTIVNPYQLPKISILKNSILDIRAVDRRGVTFIVEMQVEDIIGFEKKFQYYVSKAYASQIQVGEDYPKLNQVILVAILDFSAFQGDHYLTRHLILNDKTHLQELKDLEFNFIELPKFTKTENDLTTVLDKWIYFIKYADDLEVMPVTADFEALQEAYQTANQFGWSAEELEFYESRAIKMQDERGALEKSAQIGEERGIKIGEKRGIKIGEERGRLIELWDALEMGLELKFGADGLALMPKIRAISEIQILKTLQQELRRATALVSVQEKLYRN